MIEKEQNSNLNRNYYVFIPEKIKIHFLKPYLKRKLKAFAKIIAEHYRNLTEKQDIYQMQRHLLEIERAISGKRLSLKGIRPKRPRFFLFKHKKEIKDLIKAAISNKHV